MNTKGLALIITFSGLAFILNPAISGIGIPYPLLPGLIFQIWEIPTLVSFLLFGWKIGLPVAGINSFFLLTIYPSMSQPWYWLASFVSVTSMTLGVVIAIKLMSHRSQENHSAPLTKTLPASLALGILLRVVFMAPVMVLILSVLTSPPVALLGVMKFVLPPQAIFNVIVPLYMIPASFLIAKVINKNLKIGKVTI
jgi:hypothetical protein